MFSAWVDESGSDSRRDPGTYILSAALVADIDEELCRDAMRKLLLRGQRKLHWRDDASRHSEITKVVADLAIEHLVVVRSRPEDPGRLERQRRLCLERLVVELAELGVTRVVAESRGRKDDQRDVEAVNNLRRRKILSDSSLRIHHAAGPAEPLLWVADVCCGVMTRHRCGDSQFFDQLLDRLTVRMIDTP